MEPITSAAIAKPTNTRISSRLQHPTYAIGIPEGNTSVTVLTATNVMLGVTFNNGAKKATLDLGIEAIEGLQAGDQVTLELCWGTNTRLLMAGSAGASSSWIIDKPTDAAFPNGTKVTVKWKAPRSGVSLKAGSSLVVGVSDVDWDDVFPQ